LHIACAYRYNLAAIAVFSFERARQEIIMRLSARNVLKGKITEVKKGTTTAHVLIDVGGTILTASITNESVDDMKLTVGQSAYAVIKSPDVMIGID